MRNDQPLMSPGEQAVFALRALYEQAGYRRFKMNKFEPYDLYVRNKNFLADDHIITFTDPGGRMMALKPDVTLSIVKSGSDGDPLQQVYYNESVYRVSKGTGVFKEMLQVGLECIGELTDDNILQVLLLAAESLAMLGTDSVLDISDMGVLSEVLDALRIPSENRESVLRCIGEKNPHELSALGGGALEKLLSADGCPEAVLPILHQIFGDAPSPHALRFYALVEALQRSRFAPAIRIDFSVLNDLNYYNGIVFSGFVRGVEHSVLSGGQYDKLMERMGRRSRAIGFAAYLDFLDVSGASIGAREEAPVLNIALPKGRLGEKVYDLFERGGFPCPAIRETNRKLIFENEALRLRYFWVKPSDVAIYVERGAADIGVCGKDILLEYEPDVYELLDLLLGRCRMAVAAKADFTDNPQKTLRVATKFAHIAQGFYNAKGRDIDIVHLNGSIEIAPVLGLTDVIVDIVETGATLRENDLAVLETIVPISARLIANKSSFKFKRERIAAIASGLAAQLEDRP